MKFPKKKYRIGLAEQPKHDVIYKELQAAQIFGLLNKRDIIMSKNRVKDNYNIGYYK